MPKMDKQTMVDTIGKNIERLRRQQGLTQAELSERADISESSLFNYIRGYTEPNLFAVMRISQVLNVTIEELMK